MKYEYCCKCDCATGKAGAGDDSLYTETDGPFCENCFPEFKSKQEQDEPVATLIEHYAFTDGIVRFDGVENLEQLPVGTKLYTTPQQENLPPEITKLVDEHFWELV